MIKPDGVRRKLVGKVIQRYEESGVNIIASKMMHVPRKLAEKHYAEHRGKEFYENLIQFITSGPVISMVLEGEDVISLIRKLNGATNPAEAASGTIRGDFKEYPVKSITENIVHASDSKQTAKREIELYFKKI